MAITIEDFAVVLHPLGELSVQDTAQLLYIIQGGTAEGNPYSLQAIADFLIKVDEYIDGAADLAEELAELAKEAGIEKNAGGTMRYTEDDDFDLEDEDDTEDEDLDDDDDVDDDDEEEEAPKKAKAPKTKKAAKKQPKKAAPKTAKKAPAKKAPAKKAPAKKAAKKEKKQKAKGNSARNPSVPAEDRIPVLTELLGNMKDGGTINEIYSKVLKTKTGEKLFPTRRSVKRVLTAYEGEAFQRQTSTIWEVVTKKATPKKATKTKK